MKPIQVTFVKTKILGISNIEFVVFQACDQVILFSVDLNGQVEQKFIALGLYPRIVFRNVEIFQS